MLALRIGIQLASLKLPFRQALHMAAELGADAVELDARHDLHPQDLTQTGVRELRKLLDDRNLRVCAVSFPTRRGYDVPDELDRRVDATKQAMSLAFRLGCPVVVNQIGCVPDDQDSPAWNLLVQVLHDLGRHGQRVGARLAARTGAEPGERLAALLAALPHGAIGVDLDPGGLIIQGFSASAAVTALGPHILHVHARDATRDPARRRGIETPLGRGSVDFAKLLAALEEHEYRGYLTLERLESRDPAAEFAQSMQYLRSLFA